MLRVKPPWSASVRLLDERDRGAVLAICDRDPVTNVFVSSRIRSLGLWGLLRPHWGPAREVRPVQPVMVTEGPPLVAPDPLVRRVRPEEIDILWPACVAMFTEEVGV